MTQEKRVTILDLEMPKAVVLRRIKHAVDGKPFQKEAKLALTRAVTVFISYLTSHAVEEADGYQRPVSITSAMLRNALGRIGLGELEEEINGRMQRHLAYTRMRAKQRTAHASIVQESGVEDDDEEEEEEEDEEEDEDEDGEDGGSHGIGETFEGRERGHAKVEEAMETKSVSGKRSARLAKSLSRSLPSQSPLTNGGVPAAPMMATEDELATEDDNANYGEGSSSGRGRHVHADKSMIDNIEDDRDSANDSADDGANDMDDGRNSSDGEDEGESGGEETQMY